MMLGLRDGGFSVCPRREAPSATVPNAAFRRKLRRVSRADFMIDLSPRTHSDEGFGSVLAAILCVGVVADGVHLHTVQLDGKAFGNVNVGNGQFLPDSASPDKGL